MCKSMETMKVEAANIADPKKAMDIASAMIMAGKYALEEVSALCGLLLDEVKLLQMDRKAQCRTNPEPLLNHFSTIYKGSWRFVSTHKK